MKKKLLFVTGSRGEWGYIRPILRLCQKRDDVESSLCVTNMHLLPAFGMSKKEIENDGFTIDHTIYMAFDGYNHYSMAKSLGVFLSSFVDILASEEPSWIVLAGDRGEQLMSAIAGAFCYVPTAHIQAGELSGNIDGTSRHAIGKLAHIHFASNEDAAKRLRRLGEQPFRIHNVGAPQLDELAQGLCTSKQELEKKYSVDLNDDYFLVVQHPVTEESAEASSQIDVTMNALNDFPESKFAILPNNDAGSVTVRKGLEDGKRGNFRIFANLKREDYLGLMKHSKCMVGNSSSGLIEAPTFGIPAVNIGTRQHRRIRASNVIDTAFEKSEIVNAVKKATSKAFKEHLKMCCKNPYGDGKSSERIVDVLLNTPANDNLLTKRHVY